MHLTKNPCIHPHPPLLLATTVCFRHSTETATAPQQQLCPVITNTILVWELNDLWCYYLYIKSGPPRSVALRKILRRWLAYSSKPQRHDRAAEEMDCGSHQAKNWNTKIRKKNYPSVQDASVWKRPPYPATVTGEHVVRLRILRSASTKKVAALKYSNFLCEAKRSINTSDQSVRHHVFHLNVVAAFVRFVTAVILNVLIDLFQFSMVTILSEYQFSRGWSYVAKFVKKRRNRTTYQVWYIMHTIISSVEWTPWWMSPLEFFHVPYSSKSTTPIKEYSLRL